MECTMPPQNKSHRVPAKGYAPNWPRSNPHCREIKADATCVCYRQAEIFVRRIVECGHRIGICRTTTKACRMASPRAMFRLRKTHSTTGYTSLPSNHILAGDLGRELAERTTMPHTALQLRPTPPTGREPALVRPLHAQTPCHRKRTLNFQPHAFFTLPNRKYPLSTQPGYVTGLARIPHPPFQNLRWGLCFCVHLPRFSLFHRLPTTGLRHGALSKADSNRVK